MNNLIINILTIIVLIFCCFRTEAQELEDAEVLEGQCLSLYEATESSQKIAPSFSGKCLDWFSGKWSVVSGWCKEHNVADRLDVGVSVGTLGIGLEVKTPATKWVDVRAGIDWVPRFKVPMDFNLSTFEDGLPTGNFHNVAQMVYEYTGLEMDESVRMYGIGSMVNFKLLADIYPVPTNRHWHITAGFYAGTSQIGRAYNSHVEKPTLVALNIYNRAFEYFSNVEDIYDVALGGGTYMDPELVLKLKEKFNHYGRLGIHIGDFKSGGSYIMEPSPDGTVTAKALVNHFKPYLGGGYSTELDSEGKWHFGVDVGVLFWGGVPRVINHDYLTDRDINFTKDLMNIRGKVGDYVKIMKGFPVYPMLSFRFSYTIL